MRAGKNPALVALNLRKKNLRWEGSHGGPGSALRRMSGMLHALFDRVQSVSKRGLSGVVRERDFRGVQADLFLPEAGGLQSMEWERLENLFCFERSLRAWIRRG